MNQHGRDVAAGSTVTEQVTRRLSLDEFADCSRTIERIQKDLFDPEKDQKLLLYELGRLGPDCHHFFEGYDDHIAQLTGGPKNVIEAKLWSFDEDEVECATVHEWAAVAVRDYYKKIFPQPPPVRQKSRLGITSTMAQNHLRTLIDRQIDTFLAIVWDMNRPRVARSANKVASQMKGERALVLANPPAWAVNPGGVKGVEGIGHMLGDMAVQRDETNADTESAEGNPQGNQIKIVVEIWPGEDSLVLRSLELRDCSIPTKWSSLFKLLASKVAHGAAAEAVSYEFLNKTVVKKSSPDDHDIASGPLRKTILELNQLLGNWASCPDSKDWIICERKTGYALNNSVNWSISDKKLNTDLKRYSQSTWDNPTDPQIMQENTPTDRSQSASGHVARHISEYDKE